MEKWLNSSNKVIVCVYTLIKLTVQDVLKPTNVLKAYCKYTEAYIEKYLMPEEKNYLLLN